MSKLVQISETEFILASPSLREVYLLSTKNLTKEKVESINEEQNQKFRYDDRFIL